jgi:hypothetical protein
MRKVGLSRRALVADETHLARWARMKYVVSAGGTTTGRTMTMLIVSMAGRMQTSALRRAESMCSCTASQTRVEQISTATKTPLPISTSADGSYYRTIRQWFEKWMRNGKADHSSAKSGAAERRDEADRASRAPVEATEVKGARALAMRRAPARLLIAVLGDAL